MRSRKHADEQVAEVARRRLALLSAELAGLRPDPVDTPVPGSQDKAGELPDDVPSAPPMAGAGAPGAGRHAHRPVDTSVALGGWLHDRLPATLQGRVRVGVGHGLVGGAGGRWRDDPAAGVRDPFAAPAPDVLDQRGRGADR